MTRHIIIVGAVAGGATCASQIRRLDKDSDITIYEKDAHMSFANCGLPYYLGNVVEDRDDLLPETPESFKSQRNINVHLKHEVIEVNTDKQTVTVLDKTSNEQFEKHYDALILSPGARARQFDFDCPHLFSLRNMEDTDAIESYIQHNDVKRVLVVGAGYVSLEVLDNMYERGLHPTLIHRSESVNKLMDQDMNDVIFEALNARNIPYRLNEEIQSIDGHSVTFTSGKVESYDMVITGIGVLPNSDFLQSSGIELNDKGYISVNDYFQTSVSNVYAIGDIATHRYRHVNLEAHVPLAWGAHRAASIVAEHLTQDDVTPFKGFIGANIVRFFDYTLASTGVSPGELDAFNYQTIDVQNGTHAGYYPENTPVHLRVYFDQSTRQIIRACATGQQGVDKRIDVLTMAMMHQAKIDDLVEFEVAYAPPYSHPKDLINMIGYKAKNK